MHRRATVRDRNFVLTIIISFKIYAPTIRYLVIYDIDLTPGEIRPAHVRRGRARAVCVGTKIIIKRLALL